MMRNRPFAWWFGLFLGGLVAASSGCYRPTVSPVADALTAAEPSPHSAGEPEKAADDKKDADAPPFHFPDDAGGALLSRVLPPADVKGPLDEPNAGSRRPSPSALDGRPTVLPLPPTPPAPPPPPGEHARKTPAPHLVMDETLGTGRGDPIPPEPRSFYAGDRVRLPSVDANQPPPLPILADQPTPDRASAGRPDRRCVRRGGPGGDDAAAHETGPVCPRDAARPLRQPPAAHSGDAGGGRPAAHGDGASAEAVDKEASGRLTPAARPFIRSLVLLRIGR